jgi:hypothetical protein
VPAVDLAFVLDSSGSLQSFGWDSVKQFASDMVGYIDVGSNLARLAAAFVSCVWLHPLFFDFFLPVCLYPWVVIYLRLCGLSLLLTQIQHFCPAVLVAQLGALHL